MGSRLGSLRGGWWGGMVEVLEVLGGGGGVMRLGSDEVG